MDKLVYASIVFLLILGTRGVVILKKKATLNKSVDICQCLPSIIFPEGK